MADIPKEQVDVPKLVPCGVYAGILFSRKPCGQPAQVRCGRCHVTLCQKHMVVPSSGPFLCPQCERYLNDSDWDYDDRNRNWRWRSRTRDDDRPPNPAPVVAAGAGNEPPALGEDDKEGLAMQAKEAAVPDDDDGSDDVRESDFDAS